MATPEHGAVDVPLNAVPMWLWESGAPVGEALQLVRLDTDEVVGSTTTWVESRGRQDYAFVTPGEPLLPETGYGLSHGGAWRDFTTGQDSDEEAPPTPEILALQGVATPGLFEVECGIFYESSCGTAAFAWLTLDEPVEPGLVEVEVVPDSDDDLVMTAYSSGTEVHAVEGACLSNMSRLEHENGGTVRVRALDLAGNPSPWTESRAFELAWPEAPDCQGDSGEATGDSGCGGCAAGTGRPGVVGWLAVLGLWARRRPGSALPQQLAGLPVPRVVAQQPLEPRPGDLPVPELQLEPRQEQLTLGQ